MVIHCFTCATKISDSLLLMGDYITISESNRIVEDFKTIRGLCKCKCHTQNEEKQIPDLLKINWAVIDKMIATKDNGKEE